MQHTTHESYVEEDVTKPGSERSFGVTMAVVLGLLASLNWWRDGHWWPWAVGVAALLLVAGLLYPRTLAPFNRVWFRFGLLLHKVVNPIVMGLMFYGAVVPTGLIMRAMGKDPLRLRRRPDAQSYWIDRQPPGPAPASMKDQF